MYVCVCGGGGGGVVISPSCSVCICTNIFKHIITMKQRSAKVLFQGGILPDPPSRALAGGERRFWAGNINRTLFILFNLASLG